MTYSPVAVKALEIANQRWSRLLEIDPSNPSALLQLASNHIHTENLDEAQKLLDSIHGCLSNAQRDRQVVLTANVLKSKGDLPQACKFLKQEIDSRPTSDDVKLALAQLSLQLGQNEQVLETIGDMTLAFRRKERSRLIHARALARLSKWSECVTVIGDPKDFSDRRTDAIELLCQCFVSDRRFVEARAVIEQMSDDIEKSELDTLRGQLAFSTQDYSGAIEHFRNAKTNENAKLWLVRTLYAINRRDEAATEVALLSDNVSEKTRALCWEAAGHLEKASAERHQLTYRSRDKSNWSSLAEFYFRYRDWGRAWKTIADAQRAGIESDALRRLKHTLQDGFNSLDVRPPKTRIGQKYFKFYSSERIVERLCQEICDNLPLIKNSRPLGERKVALVINSLGPGGAERQVVNLANGLSARSEKIETHLLCTHLDRDDRDRFYLDQVDTGVTVTPWYDRHRPIDASSVPALAPYANIINHLQPVTRREKLIHLVHTLSNLQPDAVHGWLDETFLLTSLAGRLLGIPVVAGRWGSMPPGIGRTVSERDKNDIAYLTSAYRSVSQLPDLTLSSNSRLTGDAYARLMGKRASDVRIVYNGIDEASLKAQNPLAGMIREELGIPPNAPVVGTVFRMSEEKRPLLWVNIASQIAERHPDWHFVMVGEGPLRCNVEQMVIEKNLQNIHLTGSRTDIGACFAMMDIMLLTSRVEGVSNAVVEAQFCGCPVIAPNVGGLSEAMEDGISGTLLATDANKNDFATAVELLMENPEKLASTARSAQQFASSRFSVKTMVSNYAELLCPP